MSGKTVLKEINSRLIGSIFAIMLLVPQNVGIDFYGINIEDLPLIFAFLILSIDKIKNLTFQRYDKLSLGFIFVFVIYTTFFVNEVKLFNQTNLRFYFYFLLAYMTVDFLSKNNSKVISIFEPLGLVMLVNFAIVIFRIEFPGTIDGWIPNNTESTNLFTSGRLGGLQGGGPNVIGIFCALYSFNCLYKILNAKNPSHYVFKNKFNSFFLIISLLNLLFTFSRGSYLALFVGLFIFLLISDKYSTNFKFQITIVASVLIAMLIYSFPSVFLKETNRKFLSSLAIQNVSLFEGSGGGNYIKNVYKDYLITMDDKLLYEQFNISYSSKDRNLFTTSETDNNNPVEGYLKLKFDYQDNFLPRSIISFYYSNDGIEWNQLGSDHTSGIVIDLIENDSYFEVGGWGDGKSIGEQHLSGYVKNVNIITKEYQREFTFSPQNRDIDYYLLTPEFRNEYKEKVEYKNSSIYLARPRDYWVALPNEVNLSEKDFEIILNLDLNSIPKGHETLFSQSSILRINEEFNDQSWRWSIIDGRMYFFWIENVISGYSKFIGGQSLRSGKLISDEGRFSSIIANFSISQYDEITTSHNGFLTMAVEYSLFLIAILVLLIFYFIYRNFNRININEICMILILLTQNFTNDLVYSPDVGIYFWIIPFYFLSNTVSD